MFATLDFGQYAWQGLLLLLIFATSVFVAWSPIKKIRAHFYLRRLIKRLGRDSLRHFSLMDGADIPLNIEYLILQPDGLLLLIVKPYRGNIFAADKIENWTQVVRHHSFKFPNPLLELETNLQALRVMFPKLSIRGLVAFAQGANFPKGKPAAVCDFDELKTLAANPDKREVSENLRQTWLQLSKDIQMNKDLKPVIFYQRGDKRRLLLGIILLIICLIYIAYIMGWLKGVI